MIFTKKCFIDDKTAFSSGKVFKASFVLSYEKEVFGLKMADEKAAKEYGSEKIKVLEGSIEKRDIESLRRSYKNAYSLEEHKLMREDSRKLVKIVGTYILQCMLYKIGGEKNGI